MTFPNVDRLWLILVASFNRFPVACVFDCRSDPARSTRCSFPTLKCCCPSAPRCSEHSAVMVKMAWEREERAFISVPPTDRLRLPIVISLSMSSALFTTKVDRSLTYTPTSGRSFTSSLAA